jgi:acetolactate synthase-1/2/3 large subunit
MKKEKGLDVTGNLKKSGSVKMTGGKFIAETFKGYGVTHIFFVEAILRQTLVEAEALGIKRVLTHSEKTASYMADGYARASKRPGVCMSQSVGAANLASGLQDAFLGLSPVIAITGRMPSINRYRNAYQEIEHVPLFDSVTKYQASIDVIEQLPFLLRQAFREATSGDPRPVHLDVTDNLGKIIDAAESEMEVIIEDSFTHYPPYRPRAEVEEVQKAARLLEKAERPIIVAGGGATASGAGPEIVELAEKLSIPVATSLNGRGVILENHPLSVGTVGGYSRWCANQAVWQADLVVFIGSHTGDQVTNGWTIPKLGTPVIHIDLDPREIGRSYPAVVGLVGDAKVTVRSLYEAVDCKCKKESWAASTRKMVRDWRKEVKPLKDSNQVPIRPERLCKELTELLPSNAILVADTGYSSIWTATMVDITQPGQSFIRAAGSLGWSFPASLGAKCGAPERPVICFIGDGGFWYHLSEMETAVRCGIPTVTVVNNNFRLSQDELGVHRAYGTRTGKKEELFRFREVNFARLAEEIGCLGIRVEKPEHIAKAILKALEANRPAVVEVITDPACKAPDPWKPA